MIKSAADEERRADPGDRGDHAAEERRRHQGRDHDRLAGGDDARDAVGRGLALEHRAVGDHHEDRGAAHDGHRDEKAQKGIAAPSMAAIARATVTGPEMSAAIAISSIGRAAVEAAGERRADQPADARGRDREPERPSR